MRLPGFDELLEGTGKLNQKWTVSSGQLWIIPSRFGTGHHRLVCGDSSNASHVSRLMGDQIAQAVITDPPYNLNLERWDAAFSLEPSMQVIRPYAKEFVAVFCQMPILLEFAQTLKAQGLIYRDCITWVKRSASTVATPLHRSYENILIYAAKKEASYHQTKGYYEDIKLPLLETGGLSLDGLDRHIKDLRHTIKTGKKSIVKNGGLMSHGSHNYMPLLSDRSPTMTNYTNVWSFQTENKRTQNTGFGAHPTMKPVGVMIRLCELLAAVGSIVLDPFSGSGTTLEAAEYTRRLYHGLEIDPHYVAIILDRAYKMGLRPYLES